MNKSNGFQKLQMAFNYTHTDYYKPLDHKTIKHISKNASHYSNEYF